MSNHTFKATQYTREDNLQLCGSPLGWRIVLTGHGPTWFYKDRWIISTQSGITTDQILYPTFEEAMAVFVTLDFPDMNAVRSQK